MPADVIAHRVELPVIEGDATVASPELSDDDLMRLSTLAPGDPVYWNGTARVHPAVVGEVLDRGTGLVTMAVMTLDPRKTVWAMAFAEYDPSGAPGTWMFREV